MNEERYYLYPVWVRLWHLFNALCCLFLILTGISMQFSNPKVPLIRFDIAVTIHNTAGILLAINYLIFFAGNFFTRNGRFYKILFPGFTERLKSQYNYYTRGIFRKEPAPFPVNKDSKFNPLQLFSYVMIMYLVVPVIFISGLALMYPEVIPTRFWGLSGLHLTDLVHIFSGFVISVFMFVHIYFCTIGKSPVSNFKSIISGYHESH